MKTNILAIATLLLRLIAVNATDAPTVSAMPSDSPSLVPSDQPSDQPSVQPSDQPSVQPSVQPSDQPSDQPSSKPSNEPSDTPSDVPNASPSSNPSTSSNPSSAPSKSPSSTPSVSHKPSSSPSAKPSAASNMPSTNPTSSLSPTRAPTACEDSPLKLVLPWNKKKKDCKWIGRNPSRRKGRCNRDKVRRHCPLTCEICDKWACKDSPFSWKIGRKNIKTCAWVKRKQEKIKTRCAIEGVKLTCRETCGFCNE